MNGCMISDCVMSVGGKCCENVPTVIAKTIPHSKNCPYYSNNFDADVKEMKACGGLTKYNRKLRGLKDEEVIVERKKRPRKNVETDTSGLSPSPLEECESSDEATSDAVPEGYGQ